MLLRAAADVMPEGVSLEIASIRDIPLYDADVEADHGLPEPVQQLKERIAAADIPRVFRSLPTGVIGATPGMGGTILSQASWLPVLRVLGVLPWFEGRVIVSGAGKVFDEGGRIVDTGSAERLRIYVEGFAAFVAQRKRIQS